VRQPAALEVHHSAAANQSTIFSMEVFQQFIADSRYTGAPDAVMKKEIFI